MQEEVGLTGGNISGKLFLRLRRLWVGAPIPTPFGRDPDSHVGTETSELDTEGGEFMHTLRSVRPDEPFEARENVDLRRMLARLTYGTHDWRRGFVLLLPESEALYAVLAHRVFSLSQLEQAEAVIRELDRRNRRRRLVWQEHRLISLMETMRQHVDRPEWIDLAIERLHAAMRAQGSEARFRLSMCRATLVAFLTIDFLPTQPEELLRLTG